MNLLRKFHRLPKREKHLFFRAVFMLFYYRIRLKTTSLQTLFTSVCNRSQKIQLYKKDQSITPERIGRLISRAARFVPYATCLSQALVGKILFAENGYTTEFHIGVCKDTAAGFEAHAWLSLDEKIILGYHPDLSRYKELPLATCQDII